MNKIIFLGISFSLVSQWKICVQFSVTNRIQFRTHSNASGVLIRSSTYVICTRIFFLTSELTNCTFVFAFYREYNLQGPKKPIVWIFTVILMYVSYIFSHTLPCFFAVHARFTVRVRLTSKSLALQNLRDARETKLCIVIPGFQPKIM